MSDDHPLVEVVARATARDDAARVRAFAKTLAGPWDRMEDGRELIVMAFPAGEADAASKLLRQAAREIETGQRILSL